MSSSDVAETGEDRSFDRKDKEATSHQETINSSANARQRALDDEFGGPEARAKLEVGLDSFPMGCWHNGFSPAIRNHHRKNYYGRSI